MSPRQTTSPATVDAKDSASGAIYIATGRTTNRARCWRTNRINRVGYRRARTEVYGAWVAGCVQHTQPLARTQVPDVLSSPGSRCAHHRHGVHETRFSNMLCRRGIGGLVPLAECSHWRENQRCGSRLHHLVAFPWLTMRGMARCLSCYEAMFLPRVTGWMLGRWPARKPVYEAMRVSRRSAPQPLASSTGDASVYAISCRSWLRSSGRTFGRR